MLLAEDTRTAEQHLCNIVKHGGLEWGGGGNSPRKPPLGRTKRERERGIVKEKSFNSPSIAHVKKGFSRLTAFKSRLTIFGSY